MKREQGRGLLVLLLAAGLILGSGILVYCVWHVVDRRSGDFLGI